MLESAFNELWRREGFGHLGHGRESTFLWIPPMSFAKVIMESKYTAKILWIHPYSIFLAHIDGDSH